MRLTSIPAVVLAATAALHSVATAELNIDLRFTDGSKLKSITAGDLSPVTINAWAVVTGAPGNANSEGLLYAIFAVQSQIAVSGITGGITSATNTTGWNRNLGTSPGAASNLTNDGIGDWGNASNTPLNLGDSYFRARANLPTLQFDFGDANSPVGSVYNSLPDGGKEFLVGSFVFTPAAMPADSHLNYIPVRPLGGTNSTAGWAEDVEDKTIQGSGQLTPLTGIYNPATPNPLGINGVTMTTFVPEPASLSFIGLLGMGLVQRLARNR